MTMMENAFKWMYLIDFLFYKLQNKKGHWSLKLYIKF